VQPLQIGLLVNHVDWMKPSQSTTRLAATLSDRGHAVWLMGLGDLALDLDTRVHATARSTGVGAGPFRSMERYLEAVRGPSGRVAPLVVDDLDALVIRINPARDKERPWAQQAGIHFGRVAASRGVLVLNDPDGLSRASTKLYLQQFPEAVRPRTLVTRSADAIRSFAKAHPGPIILKPMLGTGGAGVFRVRPEDTSNLNQIIEVLTERDFVICQEYLHEAEHGDTRLILMNGRPLRRKGRVAAVRRRRAGEDLRSNVSAGGTPAPAEPLDETMARIAEMVRPQLVADGIFLAGLDVIGDKLVEINVFAPGGLDDASRFEKVNFATPIAEAIEQKVRFARYGHDVPNAVLATL
jgi:glutathione synthase